jgi:DNA-binding FrmR family transcriptional regulator
MTAKNGAAAKKQHPISDLQGGIAAARKALNEAKRGGDKAAIAAANAALQKAHAAVVDVHMRRFETIGKAKGNTAARAMLELAALCAQHRYSITTGHAIAILSVIDDARNILAAALEAATTRTPTLGLAPKEINFPTPASANHVS